MNRVGKNNGNYKQISNISILAFKQFAPILKFKSAYLVLWRCMPPLENAEIDNLIDCPVGVFAV